MKTLAVDFDGVLHSYESGWMGTDKIPDLPVSGAIHFLSDAIAQFDSVIIFSTRANCELGRNAIRKWLQEQGLPKYKVNKLNITSEKLPATVYLDDRAVPFTGTFPSISSLYNFRTWQEVDEKASST